MEHEERGEKLVPSPEGLMALNIKKCVLQVRKFCLRDLAVEENHVEGSAQLPDGTRRRLDAPKHSLSSGAHVDSKCRSMI